MSRRHGGHSLTLPAGLGARGLYVAARERRADKETPRVLSAGRYCMDAHARWRNDCAHAARPHRPQCNEGGPLDDFIMKILYLLTAVGDHHPYFYL